MLNKVQSVKSRLSPALRLFGLIALLAAMLPASLTYAASATGGTNLTVTLTGADNGTVGQPLNFTVTVTNNTANPFTSGIINVYYPVGSQLVAPLPNPDVCGRARNSIFACAVPTLAPGDSFSIPFALKPAAEGAFNVSTNSSGQSGGVGVYASTALSVPVGPAPTDVQVSGSSSTGSPAQGANFSYTFQVKNGGSYAARSVSFADTVPASETLLAAGTNTGAPCTLVDGTVSCDLGDIAVGQQVVITVGVTAPTAPATLVNTGTANASNGDVKPGNNSFSVTIQVK